MLSREEIDAIMHRAGRALASLQEQTGGRRDTSGAFPCPNCETGTIHYGVAPNGHRRLLCDTPGCVNWLE